MEYEDVQMRAVSPVLDPSAQRDCFGTGKFSFNVFVNLAFH